MHVDLYCQPADKLRPRYPNRGRRAHRESGSFRFGSRDRGSLSLSLSPDLVEGEIQHLQLREVLDVVYPQPRLCSVPGGQGEGPHIRHDYDLSLVRGC